MPRKKFDPEDDDYDYESAEEVGIGPGENGHWPSRVPAGPEEGLQLKGAKHPTFRHAVGIDDEMGYELLREDRGLGKGVRYYTMKRDRLKRPKGGVP